jgi:hypothetical protein
MAEALRRNVHDVYSVELDRTLAEEARRRFRRARNVTIIEGDSGSVLPELVPELRGRRVLYWLDAHFSGASTARGDGDTPILSELAVTLPRPESIVVLIDDSREFGTNPEYPKLKQVQAIASEHGFSFEVTDDMGRLVRTLR